ncbi:MAG: mechanosensitive ion channel family protein [Firmicutes bacterium]|nr:mechanosensitive ion channel family protein [Bacillota bacterium]
MQGEFVREFFDHIMQYVPKIPTVILVIAVGVLLIRFLDSIIQRMLGVARIEPTLISFVSTFVKFVCWVFLIATVFSVLGFSQISLAFSGSIALVIMGVATNANSLVQDLLSGLFLLAEPDFKEGSVIRLNAVLGTIVGMDIKKTKIMDGDGNIHIVPNRMFDANIFVIQCPDEVELEENKTA